MVTNNSINSPDPVDIASGGTGAATLTGVLTGNGTSAITAAAVTQYGVLVGDASNAVASTAVGTSGQVLTSNGAGVAPTYQAVGGGDVTAGSNITANSVVIGDDGAKGVKLSTLFVSDAGEMTNASQPAFAAHNGSALTNVTGDGTTYTIIFGTEDFDQTSDYDSSTGIFTAPVAGKYIFTASVSVSEIAAGHTSLICSITTTGGSTEISRINPTVVAVSGIYCFAGSLSIDLTATQTAKVNLTVSGSTKVVDVPTPPTAFFGGYLVC